MKGKKGGQAPTSGKEAFHAHYLSLWGERWPALSRALEREAEPLPWEEGLLKPYALDPASVLAALALGRARGESCLDLCAAPGGKSLVIAGRMEDSSLQCNELSRERFFRLKRVLEEHLDPRLLSAVRSSCGDGASLCRKRAASFDRILLDAPCSSERHVLASAFHLGQWSTARVRSLPLRQWALLSSAFLMLKPGGRLVYATCSVNPEENEVVFGRLFRKYGQGARELDARALLEEELEDLEEAWKGRLRAILETAEERERGIAVMPDRCPSLHGSAPMEQGAGPMYIAVATKAG